MFLILPLYKIISGAQISTPTYTVETKKLLYKEKKSQVEENQFSTYHVTVMTHIVYKYNII